MNGRIERDLEFQKKLEDKLKGQPEIIRHYAESLSEASSVTRLSYASKIVLFFNWLKDRKDIKEVDTKLLAELLPMDIQAYMTSLEYTIDKKGNKKESSSSKRMTTWTALHSFFNFLYINKFVESNICNETKRPKNRDAASSKYLDQNQMTKLIRKAESGDESLSRVRSNLKERDSAILKLFLTTGIRVEALREIDIEDIDFEKGIIKTINKGRKIKEFQIEDNVLIAIEKWLFKRCKLLDQEWDKQTGPLFVSLKRQRISYWAVNDIVKEYTAIIGMDNYSCHTLRHSYGTAIYNLTKDIDYTRKKLGHENVNTTLRYINETDKEIDDLVSKRMNQIAQ